MDYTSQNTEGKQFTFRLLKKNTASSILDPKTNMPIQYVGLYKISNVATIVEKDKNGNQVQRIIRLLPGEPSIYKDLQSPDKDVPKKNHSISFINGRKVVDGSDLLMLEFMMKSNQNLTNPNRKKDVLAKFELVDNTVAVSKEIAKDKLISEVTNWCWNGALDEILAYARVLNIPMNQQHDEIRHNLKVIAMRDPEKFFKDLKNPEMRKKHYVLEALDRGYLVQDPTSNSISWQNNPYEPIAVAATGTSPIDVLVRKLSTEEGQLMYQTIIGLLAPDPVIETKMSVPSAEELATMKQSKVKVVEPAPAVTESDSELMDITNEGIDLKIIVKSGAMWFKYKDEAGMKKEGFVEKLKGNPQMLKSLRYEINQAKKALANA